MPVPGLKRSAGPALPCGRGRRTAGVLVAVVRLVGARLPMLALRGWEEQAAVTVPTGEAAGCALPSSAGIRLVMAEHLSVTGQHARADGGDRVVAGLRHCLHDHRGDRRRDTIFIRRINKPAIDARRRFLQLPAGGATFTASPSGCGQAHDQALGNWRLPTPGHRRDQYTARPWAPRWRQDRQHQTRKG